MLGIAERIPTRTGHFAIRAEPAPSVQANDAHRSLHDAFQFADSPEDFTLAGNVNCLRRPVKRGRTLFNSGDEFTAIYIVRHGFFKTCMVDSEGREQVSGFFMVGDSLGLDGLGSGRHDVAAIALEDSEVWVMPFAALEKAAHENPSLQHNLNAELAREIVRGHGVMMLLGSMAAEERLAAFLSNLSKRFAACGYSPCDFHMRMTREEIGSYLGLKLETVSRLFSSFAKDGLIEVDQKHVRILDIGGIERMIKSRS